MTIYNKDKDSYKKINSRCVYKYTGQKTQLLLYIDSFRLDPPSIKMITQKYDKNAPEGQRVLAQIETYIPFPAFLRISNDVLRGVYLAEKRKREKLNSEAGIQIDPRNLTPYFEKWGGTQKEGSLYARVISIIDDTYGKTSFAISTVYGYGERGGNREIRLKRGVKPLQSIYIAIPDTDLKELCLIGTAYIESYIQLDLQNRLCSVEAYYNENHSESQTTQGGSRYGG